MKNLFAVLLAFLFISSLINAQDNADLQKQVQRLNNEMAKLMLSGNEDAIWAYYSEDVISMPSYQPMMKGIDACKESSKQMMESGMTIKEFESTNDEIMVSGNFVIDIGTYKIAMNIPEMGDQPWSDNGKYMTIWEMQDDGSLLVVAETWNTDNNPWQDMQEMEDHEGQMKMQKDNQVK
jgi:ketosteroid isomerase-like protein